MLGISHEKGGNGWLHQVSSTQVGRREVKSEGGGLGLWADGFGDVENKFPRIVASWALISP